MIPCGNGRQGIMEPDIYVGGSLEVEHLGQDPAARP